MYLWIISSPQDEVDAQVYASSFTDAKEKATLLTGSSDWELLAVVEDRTSIPEAIKSTERG